MNTFTFLTFTKPLAIPGDVPSTLFLLSQAILLLKKVIVFYPKRPYTKFFSPFKDFSFLIIRILFLFSNASSVPTTYTVYCITIVLCKYIV